MVRLITLNEEEAISLHHLLGAAVNASEIQIWTDINGFHNNDPRFVEKTKVIRELSFDEAAELAYFGAKILHPSSVNPAREKNIPVRLKNTMDPEDEGTLITSNHVLGGLQSSCGKRWHICNQDQIGQDAYGIWIPQKSI